MQIHISCLSRLISPTKYYNTCALFRMSDTYFNITHILPIFSLPNFALMYKHSQFNY